MPTDSLADYCPTARKPAPGGVWRANLYKCADQTSHLHWLTWALIERDKPNIHLPPFFGTLAFE